MITMRELVQGEAWQYLTDGLAKSTYGPEREPLPGYFRGAGLGALGLHDGDIVTDEHLQRMLGDLSDPVTGEPVGPVPKRAGQGKRVAGFDLTFSVPKPVSVAWAMADQGTQALIHEAHEQAIRDTLAYAEAQYIGSRSGEDGIVFEEIQGVIAASFTHYDSRSHDPYLHDHVVVWDRARSVSDGQWRALDGAGLYEAIQALNALHTNIVATCLGAGVSR